MSHESVLKLITCCWCLGEAYVAVGGYGREFLDRVGNSARGGREGGGLWYIHVAQAARDCVVRIARRD
jgi:hypothetical protein